MTSSVSANGLVNTVISAPRLSQSARLVAMSW
jgi:hypothetical protein